MSQRREHVRLKSNRPVLVYMGRDRREVRSYSVDLAGGGLLLAGPDVLQIGEQIQFKLTLAAGEEPVEGVGTVVRSDRSGRRAVSFTKLSDMDRRRVVRFIFECERLERRREREERLGAGGRPDGQGR